MKLRTNPSPPSRQAHVTKGSVLDDLGFSAADALELKIKADIWRALIDHIESRGFGTEHLMRVLKVHQPDVSNLLNGKIGRFSVGRLIQFAARLDLNAEVRITQSGTGTFLRERGRRANPTEAHAVLDEMGLDHRPLQGEEIDAPPAKHKRTRRNIAAR